MIGYNDLDPVKRAATAAAKLTDGNIADTGLHVLGWSRGESVFLVDDPGSDTIWGSVEEGIGTKPKVADSMLADMRAASRIVGEMNTGRSYYDSLAQCNLAMALNDAATLNVRPLSVNVHWAVGSSKFFSTEQLTEDLIEGTRHACDLAGCVWGGGETPTLRDIVYPDSMVMSCSVQGLARPRTKLIVPRVEPGDSIFGLASSGIMANGLTQARETALILPRGYFTPLPNGRSFGEALLTPTDLYGPVIAQMVDEGVEIHYTVNVTGHGWRKLMRLDTDLSYIVERIPEPQPEFGLIQEANGLSDRAMYETYNMGVGFVIFAPASCRDIALGIAEAAGMNAWELGHVDEGPRSVCIAPLDISWTAAELGVR